MSAVRIIALLLLASIPVTAACAQDPPIPAEAAQDDARLIEIDRQKREVRVRCEALRVDMPLEFFCVVRGTADHEAVLRTRAKPSAVHAALLGLGLEPGNPLRFVPERKEWIAPSGPPVRIDVEWEQDGKTVRRRAGELMRNMKTGEAMPPRPWVFVGSELGPNGEYGADVTGQLVSIVNFEFSTLDVPRVASNANETLEWEINPETMPPEGAQVWMVLTPVEGGAVTRPVGDPAAEAAGPRGEGAPVEVVVVMLNAAGEVQVNNEPVALAEVGDAVRARREDQAPEAATAIRLSAVRGAPVDVLGRLLAELAEAELTDVTFVPPPPEAPVEREEAVPDVPLNGELILRITSEVQVHDGGREVSTSDGRVPLGQFVSEVRERADQGDRAAGRNVRAYSVRPAADAQDVKPVDIAAVHAALYVLGYEVEAEYPRSAGTTRPAADPEAGAHADLRLAQLRRDWEERVLPQADAIQQAAQTHYEVMEAYQQEINRLLDEVERLRQEMDQLQERYNELTAPKPAP